MIFQVGDLVEWAAAPIYSGVVVSVERHSIGVVWNHADDKTPTHHEHAYHRFVSHGHEIDLFEVDA